MPTTSGISSICTLNWKTTRNFLTASLVSHHQNYDTVREREKERERERERESVNGQAGDRRGGQKVILYQFSGIFFQYLL